MYKSNIITQKCLFLMITITKQRAFVGKSDMIFYRARETVPQQFFGSYIFFFLQIQDS